MPTQRVSSTVDAEVLRRTLEITGASKAETIRLALRHFLATGGGPPVAAAAAMTRGGPPIAAAATAAKPVSAMSDDEKLSSLKLLLDSRRALENALAYMRGEEAAGDTETRKRLRLQIADLEADIAKINARINAFQAGHLAMIPPSAATIAAIAQLAEQVGALTQEARRADQVVAAVNSVVQTWTGTQA